LNYLLGFSLIVEASCQKVLHILALLTMALPQAYKAALWDMEEEVALHDAGVQGWLVVGD
jgi:hypothetical protein